MINFIKNHLKGYSSRFWTGLIWLICIAMLVISPGESLPIVVGIAILFFMYQMMPRQRAIKALEKAKKLFRFGLYEQAIPSLNKAIVLKSQDQYINYLMGACLHNLQHFEKALDYLKIYKTNSPKNHDVDLIIANCYFQLEEYSKCINILKKTPKNFNRYLRSQILTGDSYTKLNKPDQAKIIFEKALLDLDPKSEDAKEIKEKLGLLNSPPTPLLKEEGR
jgi:tetratricopeptide (TPR) repeat protein